MANQIVIFVAVGRIGGFYKLKGYRLVVLALSVGFILAHAAGCCTKVNINHIYGHPTSGHHVIMADDPNLLKPKNISRTSSMRSLAGRDQTCTWNNKIRERLYGALKLP